MMPWLWIQVRSDGPWHMADEWRQTDPFAGSALRTTCGTGHTEPITDYETQVRHPSDFTPADRRCKHCITRLQGRVEWWAELAAAAAEPPST